MYDDPAMIKSFEILNTMFQRLLQLREELPENFDYQLFIKVMRLGLESDHCVVIVKVLIFIYNNIPIFPKYVIARFAMIVMREQFVGLYCHWSDIVRNVFHHFIWFRLYQIFGNTMENLFDIL